MQSVTRSTIFALICLGLIASGDAFGQVSLPGGGAALRERGILSRLGARLEARQERLSRPAPNGPPGPAPGLAPRPAPGPVPGAARGPQANNAQPERAPELDQDQPEDPAAGEPFAGARRDATAVRRAQYAAPGGENLRAGVQAASEATPLPPNRLPYTGPGVELRLPTDLPSEVNYLIDDAQPMVIGSGDTQHLRTKGRYEIRFSRGIDDSGRSYGEARYTITEGIYRFAVTDKGWELYRESDEPKALQADVPETLQADVSEPLQAAVPEPLEPSELSELRHKEPIKTDKPAQPVERVEPAKSETLPTPTPTLRSILEAE